MKKPIIALQLWSVRDDCKRDFAGTVRQIAEIGYQGVETAGYGNLDASTAAIAVAQAGLRTVSMHIGIDRLRAELATVIKEARQFGTRDIVCPFWKPEAFTDASTCEAIGSELDGIGSLLRNEGFRFHFHNHQGEMALIDGQTVLEWIAGAAQPRNLQIELDIGWAHLGGQSHERLLKAFGARVPLVHLRDAKEIGDGPVPFQPVFETAASIGAVEAYIVEQGEYKHPPIEAMRLNFQQLQRWGVAS